MKALNNRPNLKDIIYSIGRAQLRDAVRPRAKLEVRSEGESSKPVDAGASTSNNPKIRVLNHKDYKTWKVRIRSIYAYSSITGVFELLLVFSEDAAKQKHCFAFDNTKQAPHALMKSKH